MVGNGQDVPFSFPKGGDVDVADIQSIIDARESGKRVDPFRCTDAAYYFGLVDVSVDCVRIEREVNSSK